MGCNLWVTARINSYFFVHIFTNDMLFFVSRSDICNFANDNTVSSCGEVIGNTLLNLKFDLGHILKWFKINSLKPNPGKFQFMIQHDLGTNTDIKVNLFLDGNKIEKFQ